MSAAPNPQGAPKHVVCVSWVPSLARTRELIFTGVGWGVTSLVGAEQLSGLGNTKQADLLVLAHSVPRNEKQRAIEMFRQHCNAPVLSLLEPYQSKLPAADFGVEVISSAAVVDAVSQILNTAS